MTNPAEHSQERRNIAVIGAGIVGVSCALHLQQVGFNVTLFDRDEPGSGATYGNACTFALYGSIRKQARPDMALSITDVRPGASFINCLALYAKNDSLADAVS